MDHFFLLLRFHFLVPGGDFGRWSSLLDARWGRLVCKCSIRGYLQGLFLGFIIIIIIIISLIQESTGAGGRHYYVRGGGT